MERFDEDRQRVLERAWNAGVRRILIPAVSETSARKALAIAEQTASVFVAVGIHPTELEGDAANQVDRLRALLPHPKVVAIGEIGLDYYWVTDAEQRVQQQELLKAHLELATKLALPVILHMREESDAEQGPCATDMIGILSDWVGSLRALKAPLVAKPGVLHSFSGTPKTAAAALDLGFSIGITGPVTFPNAKSRRDLVGQLPIESLLLETDSPYLAPVPHRGRRNEPAFVAHIADRIAVILSRTSADIAVTTSSNAARLFEWGIPA